MKTMFRSLLSQFRILNRPARLLLVGLFLDGLLFAGWSLFFNLYIIDSGYSRQLLGLLNAAPSLTALILAVPLGMLSDRMGHKRAMILGFVLSNFALIGMLLARSEALILVLSLILGATSQLWVLSQAPFMMKASNDKTRDVLFSFSYAMYPLASTLGNLLAGQLPELFTNWFHLTGSAAAYQLVLLFCVNAGFLVLIPFGFIRENRAALQGEIASPGATNVEKPSIRKALLRPLTLKLALPNLAIGLGAASLVPYFNVFFAERFKLSDAALGTLFSIGSLLTGLACLIGPRLVGRFGGKVRTVVLGQGISLVFLLAIGFSPWPWLAVLGFLVRGAMMNMVSPLFDAYALEMSHEHEHGTVNSIRNLAWNLGWAIGPYISGLVQQKYGFTPLFVSTAILYSIGIGLTWYFFRPRDVIVRPPLPLIEEAVIPN